MPIRTCVACRATEEQDRLIRVALAPPDASGVRAPVVDLGRRLPGRGAWLHGRTSCVVQAAERRALGRALGRGAGGVAPAALLDEARAAVERARGDLAARLSRAGGRASTREAARAAILGELSAGLAATPGPRRAPRR